MSFLPMARFLGHLIIPILLLTGCGAPDPNAPSQAQYGAKLDYFQIHSPSMVCASSRVFRDALRNGGVLIPQNGFLRSSTNEEERKNLEYLEAVIAYRGYDCSATFSASRQQFVNFLDAHTDYRVPPMYPPAQNARKIRLQFGDPVPTNDFITTSSANAARPSDAQRQSEALIRAGSMLMGGTPAPSSGGTCFKQSERVSGFNKLCEYSCITGNTVRTIASTQLCPLTIQN